ncbi:MAG: glycosyltransferase [Candidatus Omnitrophota bacterium]|nr:glycosyltransferase [Candidatus Omnitrophota bacterium]
MPPIPLERLQQHEAREEDRLEAGDLEASLIGEVADSAPLSGRRRYPRQEIDTAVTIRLGPWFQRRRLAGVATNLSATGLGVRLNGAPQVAPGAPVRMQVDIPPPLSGSNHHVPCAVTGTVIWVRRQAETAQLVCGIRVSGLIQDWVRLSGWVWQRGALLGTAVLLAAAIGALKTQNVFWFWYDVWFQVYSLVVAVYIGSRSWLSLFYRVPPDRGVLPSASVVIAVKNEEAHIVETVEHCFRSRYPAHQLEVIVVDDGSTDQTWAKLTGLLSRYPRLRIFRFPANQGKRHAMALGAEEARGEILVYVDSDSFVDPEGVYQIVQGFADPRIGAVAGHVQVIIEPTNPISKMESVRYFISHRVMKAAESLFGCVTCCSGAFSAYRRSAVLAVLQPWLHQTFLGTTATFGDDRSLTNFILRTHQVVFCEAARCRTYVPDRWPKYFRQQLRWKKSWSRETLVASRILYRKHPVAALSYYVGVLLTLFAPLMVIRNMIVLPLVYSMSCLPYVTGLALVYLFFCCIYFYFTRSRYWAYGLTFAGLYISVLCWQNYYAMATVSRTHWGTR